MRTLPGYNKPIVALAISPDGTRLYSVASNHQMIWVWDLTKREVEGKLRGQHPGPVESLACSADGQWLLSGEEGFGAVAWQIGGKARALRIPGQLSRSWHATLAIHPNSQLVAFPHDRARSDPHGVELWNLPGGTRTKIIEGHGKPVWTVAFSPSGELLATGAGDRKIKLWDHASSKEVLRLTNKLIPTALAFRPDGKVLAVAGGWAAVTWDLTSGKLLQTLSGHQATVSGIGYSPDGKYLATVARDGTVILRDALTHELLGHRQLDLGVLGAMVWQPDSSGLIVGGEKLIVTCEVSELRGTELAKKRGNNEPLSLAGHTHKIDGLTWSRDGQALCSWGGWEAYVWDLSQGASQARVIPPLTFRTGYYTPMLTWSPDRRRLALSEPSNLRICDGQTGGAVQKIEVGRIATSYVIFTPAGRVLLFSQSRQVGELQVEMRDPEGKEVLFGRYLDNESLFLHWLHVTVVGPDDRHVYFTLSGKNVYRWTPAANELVQLFRQDTNVTGLVVTPDEQMIVTLGGNTAHVRSLPDGKKKCELKHPMIVSGAGLAAEGRLLTACNDGLVRLWDLSGGREMLGLDLGMGKIHSLAVSPDQMIFAAGVQKGKRVVLMDVPD